MAASDLTSKSKPILRREIFSNELPDDEETNLVEELAEERRLEPSGALFGDGDTEMTGIASCSRDRTSSACNGHSNSFRFLLFFCSSCKDAAKTAV